MPFTDEEIATLYKQGRISKASAEQLRAQNAVSQPMPPQQGDEELRQPAPQVPPETTQLSPEEERGFQTWAKKNNIRDVDHPDSHYDYRGAYVAGVKAGPDAHWPDTFKQHGHPTFSEESQYSKGAGDGGRWDEQGQFTPSSPPAPWLDKYMQQGLETAQKAPPPNPTREGAGWLDKYQYSPQELPPEEKQEKSSPGFLQSAAKFLGGVGGGLSSMGQNSGKAGAVNIVPSVQAPTETAKTVWARDPAGGSWQQVPANGIPAGMTTEPLPPAAEVRPSTWVRDVNGSSWRQVPAGAIPAGTTTAPLSPARTASVAPSSSTSEREQMSLPPGYDEEQRLRSLRPSLTSDVYVPPPGTEQGMSRHDTVPAPASEREQMSLPPNYDEQQRLQAQYPPMASVYKPEQDGRLALRTWPRKGAQ
jgi:hypothetical protein